MTRMTFAAGANLNSAMSCSSRAKAVRYIRRKRNRQSFWTFLFPETHSLYSEKTPSAIDFRLPAPSRRGKRASFSPWGNGRREKMAARPKGRCDGQSAAATGERPAGGPQRSCGRHGQHSKWCDHHVVAAGGLTRVVCQYMPASAQHCLRDAQAAAYLTDQVTLVVRGGWCSCIACVEEAPTGGPCQRRLRHSSSCGRTH